MRSDDAFRIYERDKCIVFMKTAERFGGLSNMAPGFPLEVNGASLRTSEALYQACRFPHLPELQRQIASERSPMTAKMRGKPHREATRPDWDSVRVPIMRWCLRTKLLQNWAEFGDLLRKTGDEPIVEKSRKDDFWGAKAADGRTLAGRNILGRLLMELRELAFGHDRPPSDLPPLNIPDFLLFGQPVRSVLPSPYSVRKVAEQQELYQE